MKKLTALVVIGAILMTLHLAAAIPVLDNANGGTWKEYIHIPITAPTTANAQYEVVINGTTVSVYNSTGYLKVSGTCPSFWNYVSTTGADIRVTNQSSELYFYIQSFSTTTKQAVIWVNLPSSSTELDIYYGNPAALPSIYNNGSKTFLFFDNFSNYVAGSLAGQNGWYSVDYGNLYTAGEIKVGNGIAYSGSGSEMVCKKVNISGTNFVLKFKINGTTAGNIEGVALINKTGAGWFGASIGESTYSTFPLGYITGNNTFTYFGTALTTVPTGWLNCMVVVDYNKYSLVKIGSQSVTNVALTEIMNGISKIAIFDAGNLAAAEFDDIIVMYHNDPATFGTPVQETIGIPTPNTIFINVTYNAYDITGHLLINNSTTLLTPEFTYIPSTASSTGFLATGSLNVPGLANITIYLDSNYTLNTVVCNGTVVTPNYLGTTTLNNINFNVYNFTSPSAGLLVITANVTPVTASGTEPSIFLRDTPTLNITSDAALVNVNTTYGATIKVSVEVPLNLTYLIYNGTELTIPTPTTVTINGRNYTQYTVTVYNSSALHAVAITPNLALATKTYADGNSTFTYVLVGEPFEVVAPVPCNISLEGVTHTNTTTVTYTPMAPNPIIGAVKIFNLTTLQFGYHTFDYPVVWGHINMTITPPIQVVTGIYSITYAKVCNPDKLYAGENKISVYYMGMPIWQKTFYLNHTNNGMNVTIPLNATNVSGRCYNMTIVSPAKFKIYNLSPIPYGKFAVNHTQEVIITFENNSPVTVTATSSYTYYPPHLYIYGSGNTTITSYYKMKLNAKSAVGLPMNVSVTINGRKLYVYGMTTKIMPVDRYEIHFPANVLGFELKNSTLVDIAVNLTNSTTIPTAVYKVPTHISLEAYKINTTSFKFPFLPIPIPLGKISTKQTNEVKACVEGTLYNWYGVPVPDVNITVKITSLKTGYTVTKVINTGSTGSFSVNFTVLPGVNYSISASFNGSPVYVGSEKKIVVAGGALPPAPTVEHKMGAVVIAGIITVCVGALAAVYMIRKKRLTMAIRKMEKESKYFKRIRR